MMMKRPTLYIYRTAGARCNPHTLYDHLHGYGEIRTTKNEFGEVFHKTYRYPGLPHHRIMRGVLIADRKNAHAIEELFERFGVSYIKCHAPVFVRWAPLHAVRQ